MSSYQPGLGPGSGDASTLILPTNQLKLPTANPDPCSFCGQTGRLRCSRCKTWYCTVQCQENHWTRHRPICEAPPPLELPDGTLYDPRRDNTGVNAPQRANTGVNATQRANTGVNATQRANTGVSVPHRANSGVRGNAGVHSIMPAHVTAAGDTDSEPNSDDVMSLNKLSSSTLTDTRSSAVTSSNINVAASTAADTALLGEKNVSTASSNSTLNTKEKQSKIAVDEANQVLSYVEIPPQIASQALPKGEIVEIVVPMEVVESPGQFSIRIKADEEALSNLMTQMVEDDGGADKTNLKIGRNEVVACLYDHLWYRGVAISKTTNIFTVYLIDFGYSVRIASGQLFPLKQKYKTVPAFNFQVCLAGIGPCVGSWSPEAIASFKEIVTASEDSVRLAVIFRGKVEGGRLGVSLVDLGEEFQTDMGNLLVELGLAEAKLEETNSSEREQSGRAEERILSEPDSKKPAPLETNVCKKVDAHPSKQTENHSENAKVQQSKDKHAKQIADKPIGQPTKAVETTSADTKSITESVKSNKKAQSVKRENDQDKKDKSAKKPEAEKSKYEAKSETAKKVRKVTGLVQNVPTSVTVTHVESPAEFYVVPNLDKEISKQILNEAREQSGGDVKAQPDLVCLACHEGVWYRAKIAKVSPDGSKVKVTFIDTGKTEKCLVRNLKTLTVGKEVVGVAVKVKLAGVEPKATAWNEQDVNKFEKIVDVGGNTNFTATAVGINEAGDTLVKIIDAEKNDVAKVCFDVGICAKSSSDLHSPETLPISPISGIKKIELDKVKRKIETNESDVKKVKFAAPTEVTVVHCVSPRDFSVLPSSLAEKYKEVITNTQEPTDGVFSPKVGEICLAMHEEIWNRAVVKKLSPDGSQAKVDLIDLGMCELKMKIGDLRELKVFRDLGGLVVRVGLAGLGKKGKNWEENEVEIFQQVVDVSGETKFMVESVGEEDGVEMVKMKDEEGNDVANMCVEFDVGVKIDETFVEPSKLRITKESENVAQSKKIESEEKKEIENKSSTPQNKKVELKEEKEIGKTVSTPLKATPNTKKIEPPPKVERIGEKPLSPKPKIKTSTKLDKSAPVDKKAQETKNASNNALLPKPAQEEKRSQEFARVSRCSLPLGSAVEVSVCFVESPGKLFVCPSASLDKFTEILLDCQELPSASVEPRQGKACLVFAEEVWYRAEVEKLSPSGKQVQAFLLDYGKTLKVSRDKVKPLDKFLDVPGLVCEVGLKGIKPAGEGWSKEETEMISMLVGAEGELKFMMTPLGWSEDGSLKVDMVDNEGNNFTKLMLEVGGGVGVKEELQATNPKEKMKPFPRTNLPYNIPVEVFVSHMESPDKMFLSPSTGSDKFFEILENCQEVPSGSMKPSSGVICLAPVDQIFYRAEITEMSSDEKTVKVFLVDTGKTVEVVADKLKPLNKFLDVTGLVAEAGLLNLTHGGGGWGDEAVGNFKELLDVGGETKFMATNVGTGQDGGVRVKMVDMEGNDITEFSVLTEVGVHVEHQLKPQK